MSRGQKPRTREHFPHMKDRTHKRRLWTFVRLDGPPFLYCGPIRGMRQALRKPDPWHIPNNPLDSTAWGSS